MCVDYDDVTNDMKKLENDFWFKEVSEILGSLMPEREEYISIYGRLLVSSQGNTKIGGKLQYASSTSR